MKTKFMQWKAVKRDPLKSGEAGWRGRGDLRTCILRIFPQDLRTQTGPVQRKKEKNKVETETKSVDPVLVLNLGICELHRGLKS